MKQKQVTVNEVEYTLQNPGQRWYYEQLDESTVNGVIQQDLMYKAYLEHVVVDPQLDIDHFDKNKGTTKNVKFSGESFSIKNPGIIKNLQIVTQTIGPGGSISKLKERELYMELITYKNKTLTFDMLDDMEDGFMIMNSLLKECKMMALDGKAGELNDLMTECEYFLTGRR